MFVSDPHIDKADAKQLLKEIVSSLRKISKDRFIIVSFAHCNMEYEKLLFPVFDKYIEITNNNMNNDKILQIDINNRNNRVMKRRKVFRYSKPTRLSNRELLLVPSG